MTVHSWQMLEAVAAVGNLAYTVLMMNEKRVGWLFGIVASSIGVLLFMHQQVYAQVGLSAYYVVMGVYGWWSWGKGDSGVLPISRRPPSFHLAIIGLGTVLTLGLAAALKLLPEARFTGLDGFATAFSLLATWMLARKVLENWAYWIVADAVAIVLYVLLGMWWYAGLYVIYVGLSASALVRWHRSWKAVQC
jgi:nicotinamide mononucleotide transporter